MDTTQAPALISFEDNHASDGVLHSPTPPMYSQDGLDGSQGEEPTPREPESIFAPSSIQHLLVDFERKVSRPIVKQLLTFTGLPQPIVDYIEVPTNLAFLLSSSYLIFFGSLYALKKSLSVLLILTYHFSINALAYAFHVAALGLSAVLIFVIATVIFVWIKTFCWFPLQSIRFVTGVVEALPEDATGWEPYAAAAGTQLKEHWKNMKVDIHGVQPMLNELYHQAKIVIKQWKASRKTSSEAKKTWRYWALHGGVFAFLSYQFTGRFRGGLTLVLFAWSLRKFKARRLAKKLARRNSATWVN